MAKYRQKRDESNTGSALIMTVVLTVLLAIVAVMFVAIARMDSAATSNIAENKMLDSSVSSIIDIIRKELILDTPPGVPGNLEYYDYPGNNDRWLANLEPYLYSDNGTPADTNDDVYLWRQISDIINSTPAQNVGISLVKESDSTTIGGPADADGDGISDSKWFEIPYLRTSKGKPIYAAVRIIDNSGMVNINIAHTFDPTGTKEEIDGNSLMEINLKGLLKGTDNIDDLHKARCNGVDKSWDDYENRVIWLYYSVPDGDYSPFDISDELELKYRYCIDSKFKARIESNETDVQKTIRGAGRPDYGNLYDDPYDYSDIWGLDDWKIRITDPNFPDDANADRRHLLTTLSLDRIIQPDGTKMLNINDANVYDFNNVFTKMSFSAAEAAQIAANIIDYRDSDSDITVFNEPVSGKNYYGFERPCVYISELAYAATSPNPSYAIELYNPYNDQIDAGNGWKLYKGNTELCAVNWSGTDSFYVIEFGEFTGDQSASISFSFDYGDIISLTRRVDVAGTATDIVVDSIEILPASDLINMDGEVHSLERDISPYKCIRRLWTANAVINSDTLGNDNEYHFAEFPDIFIQELPADSAFTNIGEIGKIFRKAAYYDTIGTIPTDVIGYGGINNTETEVRLDLALADFQKIFQYFTVIDPRNFHPTDPDYKFETRIKGRININTAPAHVIAQLPWVSLRNTPIDYNAPNLSKAIVAYRDKQSLSAGGPDYSTRPDYGFENIGQLCNVVSGNDDFRIDYYSRVVGDQSGFPDLTTDPVTNLDGAPDDFEERDLIFARISDLVTVRSDVFTAYIVVRAGAQGPQKRVTVIFDRSGVAYPINSDDPNDKVWVKAYQGTPEAR